MIKLINSVYLDRLHYINGFDINLTSAFLYSFKLNSHVCNL